LGFWPRSNRRPIPLVKTRSQQPAHQVLDALPGKPAAARRVLAPASSPSSGGVPSSRWGASRWVASALHTVTASLAKKSGHGGEADGATCSARRRGTATPRLRRPSGGAASLGPHAGVRSTLGFRPPKPARGLHHGTKAGFQELQSCARRDVEGWRVGRFHGGVVAAARWGAAGLDTRAQPLFRR
jgi:hypothetical protein